VTLVKHFHVCQTPDFDDDNRTLPCRTTLATNGEIEGGPLLLKHHLPRQIRESL
jgi:hypothetical protein